MWAGTGKSSHPVFNNCYTHLNARTQELKLNVESGDGAAANRAVGWERHFHRLFGENALRLFLFFLDRKVLIKNANEAHYKHTFKLIVRGGVQPAVFHSGFNAADPGE